MEKCNLMLLPDVMLGDFFLLAPYIQKLQEKHNCLVIAVPEFIFDLYKNQEVFDNIMKFDDVEDFLKSTSAEVEIINLSSFLQQAPIHFKPKPLLNLDLNLSLLEKFGIKAYEYFTIHSSRQSIYEFEHVIENILYQYPKCQCVALLGPNEPELSLNHPHFLNINADLNTIEQLMAGAMFHVDNNSPSISIFTPTYNSRLTEKIH